MPPLLSPLRLKKTSKTVHFILIFDEKLIIFMHFPCFLDGKSTFRSVCVPLTKFKPLKLDCSKLKLDQWKKAWKKLRKLANEIEHQRIRDIFWDDIVYETIIALLCPGDSCSFRLNWDNHADERRRGHLMVVGSPTELQPEGQLMSSLKDAASRAFWNLVYGDEPQRTAAKHFGLLGPRKVPEDVLYFVGPDWRTLFVEKDSTPTAASGSESSGDEDDEDEDEDEGVEGSGDEDSAGEIETQTDARGLLSISYDDHKEKRKSGKNPAGTKRRSKKSKKSKMPKEGLTVYTCVRSLNSTLSDQSKTVTRQMRMPVSVSLTTNSHSANVTLFFVFNNTLIFTRRCLFLHLKAHILSVHGTCYLYYFYVIVTADFEQDDPEAASFLRKKSAMSKEKKKRKTKKNAVDELAVERARQLELIRAKSEGVVLQLPIKLVDVASLEEGQREENTAVTERVCNSFVLDPTGVVSTLVERLCTVSYP